MGEIASRLTTPDANGWAVETVEFLIGAEATAQTVTLKIWQDNAGRLVPGAEIYSGDYQVFGGDALQQIDLTGAGNSNDGPGSTTPVTGFALFRRIDPGLKGYPPGDWVYLTTVPAFQEASYATIVATAADSSIVGGMYCSTFFVRAMTANPGVHFDSAPDSGYSVDNPARPRPPPVRPGPT